MLVGSALLSIVMGILVYFVGQERRIKGWFLLLCIAAAALTFGLWIEINVPNWSFAAARLNMTSALLMAIFGLASVRTLCGLPLMRAGCRLGCGGGGRQHQHCLADRSLLHWQAS